MSVKMERNFGNLGKLKLDLSAEINEGIDTIAKDIQNGIEGGGQFGRRFKRNAKSTIRKKGFDHPLKETGLMMNAKKMIKRKATKTKQLGGLIPNEERIDIGYYNQYGTGDIPSRPWFGISDESERKIIKAMEERIKRNVDRL